MPVETIKCRECGSAEVTEFKPGSYVCGHCEAIFKHVKSASGGAAGCEIDACGVAAVGRCSTCGQAYCGTHAARTTDYLNRGYVDWCARCQAEKHAKGEQDKVDKEQALREHQRLVQEAGRDAAQALARRRIRPNRLCEIDVERKYTRFLGNQQRIVTVAGEHGWGWMIEQGSSWSSGESSGHSPCTLLTTEGDLLNTYGGNGVVWTDESPRETDVVSATGEKVFSTLGRPAEVGAGSFLARLRSLAAGDSDPHAWRPVSGASG